MIPFLDLLAINARDRDALIAAFTRVLDSGRYVMGKELEAFEREYAAYCGTRHCVGIGNGLDALTLTLRAWRELSVFAPGDEVIVPANTYIATILAITENNLTPVLVEPDAKACILARSTQMSGLVFAAARASPARPSWCRCGQPPALCESWRDPTRATTPSRRSRASRPSGPIASARSAAATSPIHGATSRGSATPRSSSPMRPRPLSLAAVSA